MPCHTDPPSQTEIEYKRLEEFMEEIGSKKASLDTMTRKLCSWCQGNNVRTKSLELQIWWRDHQAWDKRRLKEEAEERRKRLLRKNALARLTPEERQAIKDLGL